jgi:hypothetical protein
MLMAKQDFIELPRQHLLLFKELLETMTKQPSENGLVKTSTQTLISMSSKESEMPTTSWKMDTTKTGTSYAAQTDLVLVIVAMRILVLLLTSRASLVGEDQDQKRIIKIFGCDSVQIIGDKVT